MESFLLINKRCFAKLNGFDEKFQWREGNDLLRRAVKKKMKFHFVKEPKYIFYFRRIRKTGN